MHKWQPIETAPKSNETVLVADGPAVWLARPDNYRGKTPGRYRTTSGAYVRPTHWMPLPPPPTNDAPPIDLDRLRAFARDVMQAWPVAGLDGGELQDIALRHGLIEPCEPTADEREEHGLEDGDEWYRRTALIGEDA